MIEILGEGMIEILGEPGMIGIPEEIPGEGQMIEIPD